MSSFLQELVTLSPRGIRYFVAIMVVVTAILCGAAINSSLGGTICTILAAIGCTALIVMIVRDVGWDDDSERQRRAVLEDEEDS